MSILTNKPTATNFRAKLAKKGFSFGSGNMVAQILRWDWAEMAQLMNVERPASLSQKVALAEKVGASVYGNLTV